MQKLLSLLVVFLFLSQGLVLAESRGMPTASQSIILERTKEIDQLLLLIQKRLVLSHETAKEKWNSNKEIASSVDPMYLRQISKLASAYGLNKDWTQTFFKAQAEADKMLQQRDFENWTEEKAGEFEEVPDYRSEVKPYEDRLTKEILQALVVVSPYLSDDSMSELISQKPLSARPEDFIPEDVWLKAIEPLYNFTP